MAQKLTECPEMPHSESIKMLNFMDFIRKSNDISFPGEWRGIEIRDEEPLDIDDSDEEEFE